MPVQALRNFLRLESAGGILLIGAALLALLVSNSPLAAGYAELLDLRIAVTIDGLGIDKPLLLWVNDGLMAIFFLLVGLELKREILEGELSQRDQVLLPAIGAVGGFVVPALIYVILNRADAAALNGWAIPSATDIAFALGVLAVLGNRVPLSLKVFLTSLAIIDDLAAIAVIGVFYSGDLSLLSLAGAGAGLIFLFILNRLNVVSLAAYIIVGIGIWVFVLKSGVHATLAGVMVAAAIPLSTPGAEASPLRSLEHSLHPWVAYLILPLFAFANAGVSIGDVSSSLGLSTVSVGIAVGLFAGKQLGVFGLAWLAIRTGLAKMPAGANWRSLYGVSVLTGIGFTMSLFIGGLAFERGNFDYLTATRLGVLSGSAASAVLGFLVLRFSLTENAESAEEYERPSPGARAKEGTA